MTKTRFSALNRLATCGCCGKRTHSAVDGAIGLDLCRVCYEAAGMSNQHSDGGHVAGTVPLTCPACGGVGCLHEARK